MARATRLKMLTDDDLARIHEASLRILQETGVVFQCEEARELFRRHGATVDGETVHIPPALVGKALASCPRSFTMHGRNPARNVVVGEEGRVCVQIANGPVYSQDLDAGRRQGNREDLVKFLRLGQASKVANLIGGQPVAPHDIPPEERPLRLTLEYLRHTDKPLMGFVTPPADTLRMFQMVEMAVGTPGWLHDHPAFSISVNPLTPLRYDPKPCQALMTYAEWGQPSYILSCALGGMTAPVSLLGIMTLTNAEMLGGIILTQLTRPGAPVIYGPGSTCADMRFASYATGTPEANLLNVAGLQLALDLYHLPTRVMSGLTDSKAPDIQAGLETMQNIMMLVLGGAHVFHETLGVIDSIMTLSFEKWLIDEEVIERCLVVANGIETAREPLCEDLIREVGHGGSYLTHPDTFSQCRRRWKPAYSVSEPYDTWERKGGEDMMARARRKLGEIFARPEAPLLDAGVEKDLVAFVEAHAGKA